MTCENEIGSITMPDGSPVSYDGLPITNYRLIFPKAFNMVFFLQEFNMPEVFINEVAQPTPLVNVNNIGEKMRYDFLTCRFLVDKSMKNYREIFEWMRRMTVRGSSVGETDNPVLIVNGIETIRFVEAWPMKLSGLTFRSDVNDVQYLSCTATFNYDYLEFLDARFEVTNP